MINAFASNLGWLFEDMKRHFEAAGAVVSDAPIEDAEAWICLRASESHLAPDIAKTQIQIHCNTPRLWGSMDLLRRCGSVVVTNYRQLEYLDVETRARVHLQRPIGALRQFTVRESMPTRPTFGWFGRDTGPNKRVDMFVQAVARTDYQAMFVGSQLGPAAAALRASGVPVSYWDRDAEMNDEENDTWTVDIQDYRSLYGCCDAVVITSEDEAGPLCLFEALACGVPVISTDCGWSSAMIQHGVTGMIVQPTVADLASAMTTIADNRERLFKKRERIRDSLDGYCLEDWVLACMQYTEILR